MIRKSLPLLTGPVLVAAVTAAIGLSGCAIFGGSDEPIQTYMFEPRDFEEIVRADTDMVLLVSPVQSVGFDSRSMAYAMRPYERTYYAFSQWADTPGRMIEPLLIQAMESSGLFTAVIDVASTVVADYRLEIDLLVLQHEFQTTPSRGRIAMRAQLTNLVDNRVVATRIFEETAQAPTENPYGGAVALNIALENILNDMVAWVRDYLDDHPVPPAEDDDRR
jgi:cholesterol transport system auxiliary component